MTLSLLPSRVKLQTTPLPAHTVHAPRRLNVMHANCWRHLFLRTQVMLSDICMSCTQAADDAFSCAHSSCSPDISMSCAHIRMSAFHAYPIMGTATREWKSLDILVEIQGWIEVNRIYLTRPVFRNETVQCLLVLCLSFSSPWEAAVLFWIFPIL